MIRSSLLSRVGVLVRRHHLAWVAVAATIIGSLIWLAIPLPDPLFANHYGTVVLDLDGDLLHVYLADDEQWRFRLGDEAIPTKLEAAVTTFEDRRFRHHPGVDPLAFSRAMVQNLRAGHVVSGASTLTMQVARLIRPKPRTVPNKLFEMTQALKLESIYTKDEILRLYLGHAPYGGNLVGANAASLRYFGRPVTRLTWAEAATLAVLPNSPTTVTPFRNRETLLKRRNSLLERLRGREIIGQNTLRESLREPLPTAVFQMPSIAPHLSRRVERASQGQRVVTTLQRQHQEAIEGLATRHARWLRRRGIHNLSILAVETHTGAVRAYVGSADFFDAEHGGQVDGVMAPRSTGSVLKPMLYAMAFDKGEIHPQSMLRDVPVYFGSYAPVNADHRFSGMVRAKDALVRSLNVPPTLLLDVVGVPEFHHLLRRAGMSTLFRSPSDYGLSLILGGAEGTLWDMVRLYRGLARDGQFDGLTYLADTPPSNGNRLLSPASTRMTLEILTEVRRPDDDGIDRTTFAPRRRVAWKTGTSFGKRDAWAIGATPDWVVGVWVGNFSGKGNSGIGGAVAAAPILFDALELLSGQDRQVWFGEAADARPVRLCADTGFRAGPDCPEVVQVLAPRNGKKIAVCPYHRAIWVDNTTGQAVCSRCWASQRKSHPEVFLILPADASQLMRTAGHRLQSVPEHNPACPVPRHGRALRVVYPASGTTLLVPRDLDGATEQVTVRAAHTSGDATLFWHLDGRYQGQTKGEHKIALDLESGRHQLQVVDQDGRWASSTFTVARRGSGQKRQFRTSTLLPSPTTVRASLD